MNGPNPNSEAISPTLAYYGDEPMWTVDNGDEARFIRAWLRRYVETHPHGEPEPPPVTASKGLDEQAPASSVREPLDAGLQTTPNLDPVGEVRCVECGRRLGIKGSWHHNPPNEPPCKDCIGHARVEHELREFITGEDVPASMWADLDTLKDVGRWLAGTNPIHIPATGLRLRAGAAEGEGG